MSSTSCGQWCFDPVADLPGDLAAICLSFLDVPTLLSTAQHVSHEWHKAIDGGLPAVWHDVDLQRDRISLSESQLLDVVRKSHGAVMTLTLDTSLSGLAAICSLSNLRTLWVMTSNNDPFTTVLASLPLLETLTVKCACDPVAEVVFPPLQFLRTVLCISCRALRGLSNLPSLTKLDVQRCSVDASEPWPSSLRSVEIIDHKLEERVLQRIAALQHLTSIHTDWSFVCNRHSSTTTTPLHDLLSFLPNIATLEELSVICCTLLPHHVFFHHFAAMSCLRDLSLRCANIPDQDLHSLAQLNNLQSLALISINTITSQGLRIIAQVAPNLTKAYIMDCTDIKDYTPVGLFSQLTHLVILCVRPLSASAHHAISQLHQLTSLTLFEHFVNASDVSAICTMRSLRNLNLVHCTGEHKAAIPISAIPDSFAMPSLETIVISLVQACDLPVLVDRFVQSELPELRRIDLGERFSDQDVKRLRNSLPRLVYP